MPPIPPTPPSVPSSQARPPNPEGYLKLSNADIDRIREIDPEITDALVRIITSPYDTFSTVKRDKEGKIISFIICTPEIDGIVYIKYFFNIVNARRNLRGLVSKIKRFSNVRSLSVQESDLRHMAIDIRKANRFLELNGFESNLDKYTEANMYTLPSAYSLDVARYDSDKSSRQYRSWIKYMTQNHNAAEVWTILHQRDRYHVEDLLLSFYKNNKKKKEKKDIQIYRLYGAIHTILIEAEKLARLANRSDTADESGENLLTKCKSIEELYELARNIDKENDRKRRAHDYAYVIAVAAADHALSIVGDEFGVQIEDRDEEEMTETEREEIKRHNEDVRKREEKQMMSLHKIFMERLETAMLAVNSKHYDKVVRQTLAELGINANDVANSLYWSGNGRFDDASLYAITYREPITKLIDLPTLPYTLYTLNTKEEMEKESDGLGHCVGDSDFYIDKVRRGEIVVMSLRERVTRAKLFSDPKIYYTDPEDDSDEIVSLPRYTLEYDLLTHTIRQWRGGGDRPVNSLPDSKELVLETLAAFTSLAADDSKYIVEGIAEDFDYDIYYDKMANEYKINDAESASTKSEALNPLDLVELSRTMQERKRVTNLRRLLQDPNIIVLKGNLVLDATYSEVELHRLCEVSGLTLDITRSVDVLKNKIKKVKGNIFSNGGIVNFNSLTEVGGYLHVRDSVFGAPNLTIVKGDLVIDRITNTRSLSSVRYVGGGLSLAGVKFIHSGDEFFKNCKFNGDIVMDDLISLGEVDFLGNFNNTFYYKSLPESRVNELRQQFPNVKFALTL